MEEVNNQILFSKPGKFTLYTYPVLKPLQKRVSPDRSPSEEPPVDVHKLARETARLMQLELTPKKTVPSSSFKVTTRPQHAQAFRNKSDSPQPGRYSPRASYLQARSPQASMGPSRRHQSRSPVLHLPKCVDESLDCVYGQVRQYSPWPGQSFDAVMKRLVTRLDSFEELKAKQALAPIPEQVHRRVTCVRDFSKVKARYSGPKAADPPNEKRFEFQYPTSNVYSRNRRPLGLRFDQISPRVTIPIPRTPLPTYNPKYSSVKPRLDNWMTDFKRMQGRKTQVIGHLLKTPASPAPIRLSKAFSKQSTVRTVQSIPPMSKTSARDDAMYRTKEQYIFNVPERQSATSSPRFVGNGKKDAMMSAAKLKGNLSTYSCHLTSSSWNF